MPDPTLVTTFLFTDIEGSTRLWEREPERMRLALACHDAIGRTAVEQNRGILVKMTGDGLNAAFSEPLDAVSAALQFQRELAQPDATNGLELKIRCGMHAGVNEHRDNDFFGAEVTRAARIMSAAHGGQILLSNTVVALVLNRLPADITVRDLGRVRLRDLIAPAHVYQLLHPALRNEFPALRSLEATPNNLPEQVNAFIGRVNDVTHIREALRATRLLTIAGTGGLGKTRLALQAAAEVLDDFPDGVWLVELAPLADERMVAQRVASVLGVKEETGRPLVETLRAGVNDRRLLILLDNCEHVALGCAQLAHQLLQACPGVKILATSREALHIGGETIYPLAALQLPDPAAAMAIGELTRVEAIRLFVERARSTLPGFELNERNAQAIRDICCRLDGIPLALELAAARVRSLSVDKIAARLTDRFHLLTDGDRTALPRQRTLRALIDWSYDLLNEPERALFCRLAVFAGGWTLEAAEAVAPGSDIDVDDVLSLLSHLVEKSLVLMDLNGERYRMLETLREYARERLDATGDADTTFAHHLRHYLEFTHEAGIQKIVGPDQAHWLERMDQERENILAAHRWCNRSDDGPTLGLQLVHWTKLYWLKRGMVGVGYQLLTEALARTHSGERTRERCRALFDAGQMASFMANYEDAKRLLEESLAIARERGEEGRVAAVLQPLGTVSLGLGDAAGARAYLEEAVTLTTSRGEPREIAAALNSLAQVHRMQGALDRAEELYGQVTTIARELGDRESVAIALLNRAIVAVERKASEKARTILVEASGIASDIGSQQVAQSVLEVTAGLAASRGLWLEAARWYGAAEEEGVRTGLHRDPADEAFLAPLMVDAKTALGATRYEPAEAQGRALTLSEATAQARAWLALPH